LINESYLAAQREEVWRNYPVFLQALDHLLPNYAGQFVVLRHGRLLATFETVAAALDFAVRSFPDRLFSIQQVLKDERAGEMHEPQAPVREADWDEWVEF
jgi:hypothetical protein